MAEAGVAYVKVKFDKASAEAATGTLKGIIGKAGVALAGAFAVDKIFDFGKSAVEEAAKTQKATENITASFGKASKGVLDFSDTAAGSFGESKNAVEGFASQVGLITQNIGLGKKSGAEMAVGFSKLAGSVGLIQGKDPAGYFDKLSKALLGNTRGLKDMGIALTPVAEKQEALALGIKGQSKDWTAAQKASIIYGLAMKKLPQLQDEAKKHGADLSDSIIKLKASFSNVEEEIGAALLPTVARLAAWLAKELPVAIKTAGEWINKLKAWWEKNRVGIINALHAIINVVRPVFKQIVTIIKTDGKIIADIIRAISDILRGDWGDAWQQAKNALHDAVSGMEKVVAGLGGSIEHALGNIALNAASWAEGIGSAIVNGIVNGLSGLTSAVYNEIKNAVTGQHITVLGITVPYATGGLVTGGTPGKDSVPAMLTPGEVVLTSRQQYDLANFILHPGHVKGSSPDHAPQEITVNVPVYLDGKVITNVVARLTARAVRAGQGNVWNPA